MKNYIKLSLVIFLALACFTSCEEERIIFDDNNGELVLVGFEETGGSFSVEVGETSVFEIVVNSSTLSNTPRMVNLEIDETSTLDPARYSLSSMQISIPANEFTGSTMITIMDNVGAPQVAETLILNISESDDFSILSARDSFTITSGIIGPFSGTYQLTVLEGVFPGFGATVSYPDGIVDIAFVSDSERSIVDLCYLPEFGSFCGPFNFALDGDQIVVPTQAPGAGVGCGAAIISQSFPDDQATVDLNDDSVFQIIFQDNIDDLGMCGVEAYRVVFELTKQ